MTRTSRYPLTTLVALLTIAVVAISAPPPASAQAVPGDDWIQYNMYGRAGWHGAPQPANRVVAHVDFMANRGDAPFAVSLQENCYRPNTNSQYHVITNQLPSYTTAHQPLVSLDPVDEPLCTSYGNMLAILGPRSGANGPSWGSYELTPDLGEDRGILCGRAFVFAWHTACTTHLTPPSQQPGGAAAQQASVVDGYDYFTNSLYPGTGGRYLGGDFNMTPSMMTFVSPNPYAFGLIEADDCCNSSTFPYPGVDKKYDYSFVPGSLYSSSTATIWSTPESDHLLVEGHFT